MVKIIFNNGKKIKCDNFMNVVKLKNYDDIVSIYCSSDEQKNIEVPLPKKLKEFIWIFSSLEILPELPKTVIKINCFKSKLKKIEKLHEGIEILNIGYNDMTSLPKLPSTLKDLSCFDNKLNEIPELPESLLELNCSGNKLTILPKLPSNLSALFCGSNQLTYISDLPKNLKYLYCRGNKINYIQKHNLFHVKSYTSGLYFSHIYDNNPIYEYIKTYFCGDILNYFDFIDKYEKKFADKIGQWYINCKYNPEYNVCKERLIKEYHEHYGEN